MLRAALAALLLLPAAAFAAGARAGYTSCKAPGWRTGMRPAPAAAALVPEGPGSAPATDVEGERQELVQAIQRFQEEGKAYRAELQRDIDQAYKAKRLALTEHFERALDDVETLEKSEREAAIARFEEFLKRYPDDPGYTPETMFRLAELYYEQANEEYQVAVEAYAEESKEAMEEGRDPPPAPVKSYARSIALYQKIITGFPRYPFLHGIYYLLAYALGEMNQGEESQAAYVDLIRRFPQSPYVPEAWVRMGDWYFDAVQADSLQRAAESYKQVLAYPDHPLFPRVLTATDGRSLPQRMRSAPTTSRAIAAYRHAEGKGYASGIVLLGMEAIVKNTFWSGASCDSASDIVEMADRGRTGAR